MFLLVFLSMGFTQLRVTQKPTYPISVFLKKDFSILHLSFFTSVYLETILVYVNDMSSLLLLIPKSHICTHE